MAATFYVTGVSSLAATVFAGGVSGINGRGSTIRVTFSGAWTVGDSYSMQLVTPSVTYQLGTGNLTRVVPTACITLNKRVHFLAGTSWYGSDNNDATQWESQAPGAFRFQLSNEYSQTEQLVSLAPYQGLIVIASQRTTQVWNLDADPNNITIRQTMANIGCSASLGMQPLGELDVLFPYSAGIRSLRALLTTLNATVADIGAPVDQIIQTQWLTAIAGKALSSSIVEPNQNRYWLYVPNTPTNTSIGGGKIYVLSYYPTNKIIAWSQYKTTYQVGNAQTNFAVSKFVSFNGTIYMLDATGAIYYYTTVFDNLQPVLQIPYYDEKAPNLEKFTDWLDVDVNGSWAIQCSPDWVNRTWANVGVAGQPTFDNGVVSYQDRGSHFSFRLMGQNNSALTLSAPPAVNTLLLKYEPGQS